jgi:threonyl-tRNA synthetase
MSSFHPSEHKLFMDAKPMRRQHPIYSKRGIETIEETHKKPEGFKENLAKKFINLLRGTYDKISWYNEEQMSESKWLTRCIFLEAVAGVPGMVGGMTRHLKSLRTMKPDHGIIHHLLEEAENERTHLFMFIQLKEPSIFIRIGVVLTQAIFWNFYFLAYLISPRFCHSLVGFLEEEAVHTYTMLLK